jgi:hypothetical protein
MQKQSNRAVPAERRKSTPILAGVIIIEGEKAATIKDICQQHSLTLDRFVTLGIDMAIRTHGSWLAITGKLKPGKQLVPIVPMSAIGPMIQGTKEEEVG